MPKFVRTARSHQRLTVKVGDDEVTVGPVATEHINDVADELVKLGEKHGVRLIAEDKDEHEARVAADPSVSLAAQRAPDLSEGVAAITGRGAPVQTTTSTDGDDADGDPEGN